MKGPLKMGEATILYAGLLSLMFVFYGLGISLGRSHLIEVGQIERPPAGMESPVEVVKPQLDFYEGLSTPVQTPDPTMTDQAKAVDAQPLVENVAETVPVPTASVQTVQVGAFSSQTDMQQMLLRLDAKGYASRVSESSGANSFYRVWVGEFERPEDAREMEMLLREDGFPTFIRTIPSNP